MLRLVMCLSLLRLLGWTNSGWRGKMRGANNSSARIPIQKKREM
jgi:hypothetical protein